MADTNTENNLAKAGVKALLHEPTVHFFLIAGFIFLFYTINQANNGKVLEIDQAEIDARIFLQEMSSGGELSEEQRQFIASSFVEEQILVQEALAMNLDNDARIHNMLAQKMRHVLSGQVIQPTEAELGNYYQLNAARYRSAATLTADELVFNNADPLSESVMSGIQRGDNPEILLELEAGSSSTLPNVNHIDLANIFATEFADQVFAANIGQWSGPFISNRGQHWLRVTSRQAERLPSLAEIADRVRLDWIAEEEDIRLQQEVDKLWDSYTILINNE